MYELPVVNRQPTRTAMGMPGSRNYTQGSTQQYAQNRSPRAPTQNRGGFSTAIFECCGDEETCWWGYWCSGLMQARTLAQFQIIKSPLFFGFSLLYTCLLFFSFMFDAGLFWFLAIMGCFAWPCLRAFMRFNIRSKLGISGSILTDYFLHCCCLTRSCAVCQEAREAKAAGLPPLDLLSGEKLPDMSALAPNTDLVDGSASPSTHSAHPADVGAVQAADGAWMSMTYVSKASKSILAVEALIFILASSLLVATGRGSSVFILLLVFVQPVVVLYYAYWKTQRDSVALDTIIKLFAIGFFVTTLQSAIFEEIIQTIGILLFLPFLPAALQGDGADDDKAISTDPNGGSGDGDGGDGDGGAATMALLLRGITGGTFGRRIMCIWNQLAGSLAGQGGMYSIDDHGDNWYDSGGVPHVGFGSHPLGNDPYLAAEGVASNVGGATTLRDILARNWPLVLLACFFMAFVVAAGVEETMKAFILRCHRFSTPLADPYTITTYLLTGALGFTVCENISYVFSTKESPIPGTSVFTGEVAVLLLRVFLPVHLICSILQGANISSVVMGQVPEMGMFAMLFSAIVLHGAFDCSLFIMSIAAFIHDIQGFWYAVLTYLVAVFIAAVGASHAYRRWKRVTGDWDNGWHQISGTSAHSAFRGHDEDV